MPNSLKSFNRWTIEIVSKEVTWSLQPQITVCESPSAGYYFRILSVVASRSFCDFCHFMEVIAGASKLRLISSESAKMIWEPSGARWPSFCRVLSFFLETSGSIWTLERFFKFQLIYSSSDFNVTTNTGLRSAKSMLVIDLFRRAPFRDFRSWFWLAKRDLKWKKNQKSCWTKSPDNEPVVKSWNTVLTPKPWIMDFLYRIDYIKLYKTCLVRIFQHCVKNLVATVDGRRSRK